MPCPIESGIQHAAIAWCLVMDHPYGVVSESDGSFRLDDLPVGKHEDGKRAIDVEYEEADNFSEGRSAFESEGK